MKQIKSNRGFAPIYAHGGYPGGLIGGLAGLTNKKKPPQPPTGGDGDLSEIARYLKAQITGFKPYVAPPGLFTASPILQGGALASGLIGIAGQRTEETPFIPNPSDVNAAFKKVPVGQTMSYMDNFFSGQQNSLGRQLANSGMTGYDTANALAGSMGAAGRSRSDTALQLINQNAGLDRQRSLFDIETDRGVNAAENQQRTNENQKLAMFSGKISEGFGAFSNINNETIQTQQQIEQMNNAKLSGLMNQLFTVKFLDKLYGKTV